MAGQQYRESEERLRFDWPALGNDYDVVGPALSPNDRFIIIEYLKSLTAPVRQKTNP